MKIAASDYDGTLFRNNEICSEDVKGVADWRARGNKFGVVSGRDYGMLAPQLHHYGIGYDYAVCNNGGIILDAGGKVLQQEQIPGMTLRDITRESCVRRSMHFAFSAADCTYVLARLCRSAGGHRGVHHPEREIRHHRARLSEPRQRRHHALRRKQEERHPASAEAHALGACDRLHHRR
jgi:hydroxymethylpyrimidine pyrophosphatase-like HAD family hydrolase